MKEETKANAELEVENTNEDRSGVRTTILNIVQINPDGTRQIISEVPYSDTDGGLEINTLHIEHGDGQEITIETDGGEYIVEEIEMVDSQDGMSGEQQVVREIELKTDENGDVVMDPNDMEDAYESMEEEYDDNPDDPTYNEEDDAEKFPCDFCERSFKTNAGLVRHMTVIHTKEEPNDDPLDFEICACCGETPELAHKSGDIRCDDCDFLFTNNGNYMRHKSLEHPKTDEYACCECTEKFKKKDELYAHIGKHAQNKPFKCEKCNRRFVRKFHLDRHVTQVGCDGTQKQIYKCQVCGKEYNRKDNLKEHLRGHAGQPKKKNMLQCQYCHKEFNGTTLLSVHIRTHTGERPYQCDLCEKRFPTSGAMTKHRRKHTGEKPYECQKCQRRFAAKETLNRHVKIHQDQKPYSCQYCGKSFIQAWQLRAHVFHHTGENALQCPHCNRAFTRQIRLTTHIKYVHEGHEPLTCTLCPKTFFRQEDLNRHLLSHTGVKNFVCDICNKAFAAKSVLKIHMNVHKKEPPCSCDECGRAFIRQDCLMRHMRAKHRDVLENILAGAEKKRLQQQLLNVASEAASGKKSFITESVVWNELTLTDSIKELLTLLVDESTLTSFGWPDCPVDKLLDAVIRRCGHKPVSEDQFDYLGRLRENAKLLFTAVIDDDAVKSLLNNQTVDEVIMHVLRLAKND